MQGRTQKQAYLRRETPTTHERGQVGTPNASVQPRVGGHGQLGQNQRTSQTPIRSLQTNARSSSAARTWASQRSRNSCATYRSSHGSRAVLHRQAKEGYDEISNELRARRSRLVGGKTADWENHGRFIFMLQLLGRWERGVSIIPCFSIQGGRHVRPRPYHVYPFFEKGRNHLRPKYGVSFENDIFDPQHVYVHVLSHQDLSMISVRAVKN